MLPKPLDLEVSRKTEKRPLSVGQNLKVVGLFAGIGGIELGLGRSGHHSDLLCEIEPAAQRVLAKRFPDSEIVADVRELKDLPRDVDLIAAGFPCQDLSQAGQTRGIQGKNSGLVDHVFRLLRNASRPPTWLLIENVPFMLQLDKGQAMRHLTQELESMGFRWAYRVVDANCFGLPQRRRRVILLASTEADPREVLFARDSGPPAEEETSDASAFGFYWTEGTRGLGWAVDAIPTLKGGSTIGIPSPPAIWLRNENRLVTPDLRDAERLQDFGPDGPSQRQYLAYVKALDGSLLEMQCPFQLRVGLVNNLNAQYHMTVVGNHRTREAPRGRTQRGAKWERLSV